MPSEPGQVLDKLDRPLDIVKEILGSGICELEMLSAEPELSRKVSSSSAGSAR
ncbi:hypothetical protein AURDEDRAFT_171717 [Auricularia subglabra TFB-10046 SS5]|nr:hypothetical protein AURDEDRAFT_171717 [Auricularia subglabra TFB-10046 SS5]